MSAIADRLRISFIGSAVRVRRSPAWLGIVRSSGTIIRLLYGRPLETLLATWGISRSSCSRWCAPHLRRAEQPRGRQPVLDDRRDVRSSAGIEPHLQPASASSCSALARVRGDGPGPALNTTSLGLNMRAVTQNRRDGPHDGHQQRPGRRADLRPRLRHRRHRRRRPQSQVGNVSPEPGTALHRRQLSWSWSSVASAILLGHARRRDDAWGS